MLSVTELTPTEVAAYRGGLAFVEPRDLAAWSGADGLKPVAFAAFDDGRLIGVLLGGVKGPASRIHAFAVHPEAGMQDAVAYLLLGAFARRLAREALAGCTALLHRVDRTVLQALSAFGVRRAGPAAARRPMETASDEPLRSAS